MTSPTEHSSPSRLHRLFRNRFVDREIAVVGRKKAFTLPFGLLNRRKKSSPNEVEEQDPSSRRRAATDYSRKRRLEEANARNDWKYGIQHQPSHRATFTAGAVSNEAQESFTSRPPSSPTTPAATATPKAKMSSLASAMKHHGHGEQPNNLNHDAGQVHPRVPSLPTNGRHAANAPFPGADESTDRPRASTVSERPRRGSFTLSARGGNLFVSNEIPDPMPHRVTTDGDFVRPSNTTSPSSNSLSPQPQSTASSSSPPPRTRAQTIQGPTPILPSQRGRHGSTSAEAIAEATSDQSYSLQRMRRTFSDAFRQYKDRQQALDRISQAKFRPQLHDTHREQGSNDGHGHTQPADSADHQQQDSDATLVSQRSEGQDRAARALPWTSAMLTAHHHLTPVGEDPVRESLKSIDQSSLSALKQAIAEVPEHRIPSDIKHRQPLSAPATARPPQVEEPQMSKTYPPLASASSKATLVSHQSRNRVGLPSPITYTKNGIPSPGYAVTIPGLATNSGDATAVDGSGPPIAPSPPSRQSSLTRLKAELVQSFLANNRDADVGVRNEKERRGTEVDVPFQPFSPNGRRARTTTKSEEYTDENDRYPSHPSPPASTTHSHVSPSYAHSSYHSHFSPTPAQKALYASKQRLMGPLEAQLAALDSQFNSMFHALEVKRLESEYTELQRRIDEKKRIVAELEASMQLGEQQQQDQHEDIGKHHSEFGSVVVDPSDAGHQKDLSYDSSPRRPDGSDKHRQGDQEDEDDWDRPSYHDQRVDARALAPHDNDREDVTTPRPAAEEEEEENPEEEPSKTASIPIRPPGLSSTQMHAHDSLPVSTYGDAASRHASVATFGPTADESNGPKMSLLLPPSMARNMSDISTASSNRTDATSRSLVGSEGVLPSVASGAAAVAARRASRQRRSVQSGTASSRGWDSSPTLPTKNGLPVEA
ncbi:unnamed protein product [Sympodiomycopsis kandeliae]